MSTIRDLGRLDDPVLIFGGPYSNLEATEAVLAEGTRLGIPPSRMICIGDTVAYCADPQAAVEAIRASGIAVVTGNVEESIAADADDCGCGFAEGSGCDRLSAQWYGFASAALDAETKRWMAALPKAVRFSLGGRRLLVVHAAPSSINRFIFASTPAADLAAEIEASGCDGVVGGHCGLPFTRIVEGRLWHNTGAVGIPANDGTTRAWYSLLRLRADGISLEHRAFTYDHTRAASKMRARGLAEGYARALETGLWPSVDILPPPERAQSGIALTPKSLLWAS